MAKLTLPRKIIEKEINLDSKTIDRLALFATPVESLTKSELELEISANRPDLFSSYGFINAFNQFEGKRTKATQYSVLSKEKTYKIKIDKSVKTIIPHIACAVVKKLRLSEDDVRELIYLQEKLHALLGRHRKKFWIGIYPLDKITFPLIYEARKPSEISFAPLGYQKEMSAMQILQKHPAGKEYAKILKGRDKYPLIVDAHKKILSMPPIINSEHTGRVTTETKEIFIECSGQDPVLVQKIVVLLAKAGADMGGELHSVSILDDDEKKTPDFTQTKIKLTPEDANKILGLNLTEKEIENLLSKMGHEYKKSIVSVQPWRTDILHQVDIIEDIAIAYGYDNIVPSVPHTPTIGEESIESKFHKKIIDLLIGLGFLETSSLHFIKPDESEKAGIKRTIDIENSKTEYKSLRPNLLIPLLRTLSENTDSEYPQKITEIGRVFLEDSSSETGISENDNLIVGITPGNFTESKQVLDYIFNHLGISYELEQASKPGFIDGRTGSVKLNGIEIGYIGEAHPTYLNSWRLKMPLSVIELNISQVLSQIIRSNSSHAVKAQKEN